MAWMMDTYSVQPRLHRPRRRDRQAGRLGGSLGRAAATSRGVVHVAAAALGDTWRRAARGAPPRCRASARSGRTRRGSCTKPALASSPSADQYGGVYAATVSTSPALERARRRDRHRRRLRRRRRRSTTTELLALDVDLLVPAAIEGVIHAEATPAASRRGWSSRAPTGPRPREADRDPRASAASLVVPDILANAGGVIVSYFEWVQANQAYWWTEDQVNQRLAERMTAGWHDVLDSATTRTHHPALGRDTAGRAARRPSPHT